MNKLNTLILTATLATLSQAALAASTHRSNGDDPKQLIVRYADLDLSKPAGAAQLYHRLQNAAEAVCSSLESRELARKSMFRNCVSESMEGAVTQVNRPSLSTFYRGKFPEQKSAAVEIASSNGIATN